MLDSPIVQQSIIEISIAQPGALMGDLLRSEFERLKRAIAAEREPAADIPARRAVEARRPRSPAA